MTEEPTKPSGPQQTECAHCGVASIVDTEVTPDWLCPNCGRFQDSVVCPTCHSVVNRSALTEGAA
jgi:predicted RNA-binding Zn-ribbon protein involved in translation (DUF1610 family)